MDFSSVPPSGVYHLILRLERPRRIRIGALGPFSFRAGYYSYTGRAMRGLGARIARHARRNKTRRWHIDYFRKYSDLIEIRVIPTENAGEEESLAVALLDHARKILGDAALPAPGFGSSDSRLPTHLVCWGPNPPERTRGIWGRPVTGIP